METLAEQVGKSLSKGDRELREVVVISLQQITEHRADGGVQAAVV